MTSSLQRWKLPRAETSRAATVRLLTGSTAWCGLCVLLTLSLSSPVQANEQDNRAIVYIYADKGPDLVEIGTGFFVDSAGDFATAYHVIRGASHLDVYDEANGNRKYDHVQLIRYDALDDVALLSVNAAPPASLHVVDRVPRLGMTFRAVGHPFGFEYQTLTARTTQDGFADSLKLLTADGRPLFDRSIPVIPLDMTMYNGMSGAPLIDATGSVIGLLVGSMNNGGSLTWAIPARAVVNLMAMIGGPRFELDTTRWQPLQSYSGAWRSFTIRKSLGINETVDWINREWRLRGIRQTPLNGFVAHITDATLSYDQQTKTAVIQVKWSYVGDPYITRAAFELENASHASNRDITQDDGAMGEMIDMLCPSDRACASETVTRYVGQREVVVQQQQGSEGSVPMWIFRDRDAGGRIARAITHLVHLVGGPVHTNEPFGNQDPDRHAE